MRIFLITADFPPLQGGISRVLGEFYKAMPAGHMTVFAPRLAGIQDEPYVKRLVYPLSKAGRFVKFFLFFHWIGVILWEVIKKKPHALILGSVMPLGPVGFVIKLLTGVPYYTMAYGGEIPVGSMFSNIRKSICKSVFESGRGVFCISRFTHNRVKALAPEAQTTVIPLGVDSREFSPGEKNEALREHYAIEGHYVLLCLGRLVQRKGVDTALRVLAQLLKKNIKVKLLIIGEGRERKKLEALALELGVGHAAVFCGEIPEYALHRYYRLADLFLFLPREEDDDVEGFGLVALEASSSGVPVIAAKSGGVPDAVKSAETGFLVQPDNIPEIVLTIEKIRQDPEMANQLKAGGRAFAESRPWSLMVSAILQILQRDLGPGH